MENQRRGKSGVWGDGCPHRSGAEETPLQDDKWTAPLQLRRHQNVPPPDGCHRRGEGARLCDYDCAGCLRLLQQGDQHHLPEFVQDIDNLFDIAECSQLTDIHVMGHRGEYRSANGIPWTSGESCRLAPRHKWGGITVAEGCLKIKDFAILFAKTQRLVPPHVTAYVANIRAFAT